MNQDRLQILSKYLRNNVAPEEFDIITYFQKSSRNSCGSVGCALGHACNIREFRELGFHLLDWEPYFNNQLGTFAAMHFFNLSEKEVFFLFFARHGPMKENATPIDVSDHIDRFIANDGIYHYERLGQ